MIFINTENINRIESEAGIIGTILHHPDFTYYSEHLLPNHFTNKENQYIYAAICNLARQGITHIDPYNIIQTLNSLDATKDYAKELSVQQLNELIDISFVLARHTLEEYKMLVDNVLDAAFKRDVLRKLKKCENLCFDETAEDIGTKIYELLDDVLMEYSQTSEVPPYREVVDKMWEEIQSRQSGGYSGFPTKFPTLNEYVTLERGELVIIGAEQKQGKSIMMLNCAVDLLKQGCSVLYIDSELSTRLFTTRLISHITQIDYKKLTSGNYSPEEKEKIGAAIEWVKQCNFTHIYMPMFDKQNIYTTVKKVSYTQGIDVLIIDYFKSTGSGDAFNTYQELGSLVDTIKNRICGDMNIAGLGAAQATSTGKLADSAKIARNASTIAMLSDKTLEEIEDDGPECGNKKLKVVLNRNGMQHSQDEYIDLRFDGNKILYEEAPKQHIPTTPF